MSRPWRLPLAAATLGVAAIGVFLGPSLAVPAERPDQVAALLAPAVERVRAAGLRSLERDPGWCIAIVDAEGAWSDDPTDPRCLPSTAARPVQPIDDARRAAIDRLLAPTSVEGHEAVAIRATWVPDRGPIRVMFEYGCRTYIWQPGHPIRGDGRDLDDGGTRRIDATWWLQGCDRSSD